MTAESDIEHLRRLIGDDCRTEDVMPLCAGLVAATPVQARAIVDLRAALQRIVNLSGETEDDIWRAIGIANAALLGDRPGPELHPTRRDLDRMEGP